MVVRPLPVQEASKRNECFKVHAGRLFDSKNKTYIEDAAIEINTKTGLITKVYKHTDDRDDVWKSPNDIDLSSKDLTVLPGFVEAHSHIMLHPYTEASSLHQERDESLVERVIRATNHCRDILKAGYTTCRDLGTESLQDADIGVRDAINRGIIRGPRHFVATEALASSGGYEIRHENRLGGTVAPRLSDPCDGVVGVRAAVRRRLGAGADIIKFYAEYGKRQLRYPPPTYPGGPDIEFPPSGSGGPLESERNPSLLLFNQEEMDEIVREANAARAPVAAHTQSVESSMMASKAGVTTVEHAIRAYEKPDEQMLLLWEAGVEETRSLINAL